MGGGRKRSSTSEETMSNTDYEVEVIPLIKPQEDIQNEDYSTIAYSYNSRIRPLLDAVDKLRQLRITKEGIQLPTIVVVGDQSSGKSSVLESLAGISLPRGQGICTRVPLIIRLQHHNYQEPKISLEFQDQVVHTDESGISDAINGATESIAGRGKGISNTPVTLLVKKSGVPDLTMVDLPGITRVPVHGQPENIYEQIAEMIMQYIKPEESIILNVLSATVDFSTCESIRMSQQVDRTGQRTLAVVTKCDKAPEGLLEKVTADDIKIGLGYVCVRNRVGDETNQEAREEEAKLFADHPQLSKINKSIVGIPVLAQKLVHIQARIISRSFPDLVRNINEKLATKISELNTLPKVLSSVAEAMTTFMGIVGAAKESLRKILIRGEFDEFPDNHNMHCTARLVEMLDKYSEELRVCSRTKDSLIEEIEILKEANGIWLPNFLPRTCFLALLHRKVDEVSQIPARFIENVWAYIEEVVISILEQHSKNYHLLQLLTRRAGHNLITRMKEESLNWILQVIEMERLTDYTCSPEYMTEYNNLMARQHASMDRQLAFMDNVKQGFCYQMEGFGTTRDIEAIEAHQQSIENQAFDLKMRITAYWKIVLMRLIDGMALQLQLSIHNLVTKEMEKEIVSELMGTHGSAIEAMLEESPPVAMKRETLKSGISVLRESKEILSTIIDKLATTVI